MKIQESKLASCFEIVLEPHEDARGFFIRTYDKKVFTEQNLIFDWVQENESFSKYQGTVRGLHFQHPPHAEAKLIRVGSGEAFIVWVDIRKESPTFGEWDAVTLSAQNRKAVLIPRGFANGLCTLSDNCTLLYKMDNYYYPEAQDNIIWNDPDLHIDWPVQKPAVMSDRDLGAKSFSEFTHVFGGLTLK